jgi:predicted nuclease of predicted toxin-antitoxin system
MKLIADENVSRILVDDLRSHGHDIIWMKLRNPGAPDEEVIRIAAEEGRVLITSDKGFGDRVVRRGVSVGVILLRLHSLGPEEFARVASRTILSRDDWEGHLSVIEPHRIRMIPLKKRHR